MLETMKNQEAEQDQEQQPEPVPKRGRGWPVEREWPEPIPDTPENIARALMAGRPRPKKIGNTSRSTGTGNERSRG